MTANEVRKKAKNELESLLNDLFREQFNLRMQKGSGQLSKPDRIRSVRRDIARIKTILHETARAET
ncbi:MAG: 50S ribosomal protein L29 [Methylococcaceae bacterium]|nr:50S ribosomal protein L29 [Methylococcaceae bacterium]MCI0668134.1 50S ribosomal protein L29 [Methylococcaceae bacterium]MCI0733157.1 50S ribosomal protein L29 [Methylococcaceae bacterium]